MLENNAWETYLTDNNESSAWIPEQMLIYHWDDKRPDNGSIDHFSAFAKFTKRNVGWKKLIGMIFFIWLIGVLSSSTVTYFSSSSTSCIDNHENIPDVEKQNIEASSDNTKPQSKEVQK